MQRAKVTLNMSRNSTNHPPIHLQLLLCALSGSTLCCLTARVQIYRDPSAPLERRVEDLVSKMPLEEKVRQIESNV